jgi:nucleoside-diphosphate-sugar epimerase
MSKILITGHLGWIGSNFTKLLDAQGIAWEGIDRREGEDLLLNMTPFLDKIADCDTVVHLAATPRIPASWAQADYYRNNNVGVTDQVARICAEQGKYLVFASSSSVYGDGDGPLNPYSWTKCAGEESIRMHGRTKNLKYTIARIFTNYGEDDASGLVISKWLSSYRQGQSLVLRGDGSQSRDFIHISDTCQALLAICQQRPHNECLDIGTGNAVKLKDIAAEFKSSIVSEPELDGYAHATRANLYNTAKYLHWTPKIKLLNWIKEQIK